MGILIDQSGIRSMQSRAVLASQRHDDEKYLVMSRKESGLGKSFGQKRHVKSQKVDLQWL